ncbi:MAG: AMP-binding protein [Rhodospirillaceae bacterium]|nr:AMP-binding protein [Rhodospirillaceae bacterium]MYB14045.1 AMP-binding protein [Rhodospirillaceae bacterium]MYI50860.1 AMP-binding protein [Rhodospirillaceae bacterium]
MTAPGPSIPAFCAASATQVTFRGRTVAIAELARQGDDAARALRRLGVGPGDRIALWLPNCPEWFALFIAAARIGAIAVMVNTRYRSTEVADIVGRSGAKALFLWPDFRAIDFPAILADIDPADVDSLAAVVSVFPAGGEGAAARLGTVPALKYGAFLAEGARSGPPLPARTDLPEAGVAIFTTSGTTDKPKFVLHSQQSATRHALDVIRAFGMTGEASPLLQTLPLCGVFGFCWALAAIAAGRPMLLEDSFSAETGVAAIRDRRVSHLVATDDMLHAMLDLDADRTALRSLRMAGFAAFSGDPGTLMDRCEAHGVPLVGLYGMSEVMALFAAQPPDAPREQRIKGAGRPVCAETAVRVRDPASGALLGRGETGALEIRTPNRMLGYFGNPDATAEAIDDDGFLRTGDAGYLDETGFVFLARMGDALRLGGFLVAPEEIMARIDEVPGVAASQVVGVTAGGKPRCAAFVIPEAGATVSGAAVIGHCRTGLAAYKAPVAVWEIEAFPTTPSPNGTKVQRRKLQQLAQTRLDAMARTGAPADGLR